LIAGKTDVSSLKAKEFSTAASVLLLVAVAISDSDDFKSFFPRRRQTFPRRDLKK
jgi:hypothetical protein